MEHSHHLWDNHCGRVTNAYHTNLISGPQFSCTEQDSFVLFAMDRVLLSLAVRDAVHRSAGVFCCIDSGTLGDTKINEAHYSTIDCHCFAQFLGFIGWNVSQHSQSAIRFSHNFGRHTGAVASVLLGWTTNLED
jgi:hypothetical protein